MGKKAQGFGVGKSPKTIKVQLLLLIVLVKKNLVFWSVYHSTRLRARLLLLKTHSKSQSNA